MAAIATLATLIYLAIQIRQNSDAVKSAAAQSVLKSLNDAIQSAASTPQLARVVALGRTDYEQLSEDERRLQAPAVRRWWKFRKSVFSPEFQGFIDGLDNDPPVLGLAGVLEGTRSDEPPPD